MKTKKKMICKNNICVDSRTVKLMTPKAKRSIKRAERKKGVTVRRRPASKNKHLEKIFFYNIGEKRAYDVAKLSTWNKNKEEQGFLLSTRFRGWMDDTTKTMRVSGPNIMIFMEHSIEEMNSDPSWANDSGLSPQTPYGFGLRGKKEGVPDSRLHEPPKTSKFQTFVKKKVALLNEVDLHKEFAYVRPSIDTYANLLDAYYHKSTTGDKDVFGIVRWA